MSEVKELANGFRYIEVNNKAASAKIALQGAHVFSYKPHKTGEVLWLSELSDFETTRSIRGGIPLCWPWFGMSENTNLPQHGFARNSMFELIDIQEIDPNTTQVVLQMTQTPMSLQMWEFAFVLQMKCTVSDTLRVELTTINTDTKPFKITQALHTYFCVSDIENIAISGLEGKPYLDALTSKKHTQEGVIEFDSEVDRVYQKVENEIKLKDTNKVVSITNSGSSSVVVWNPWITKCARMSAMKKDAYKEFVCIESANALEDFRVLQPQEHHTIVAVVSDEFV